MATAQKPNAYTLAGGINRWLDEFSADGRSPHPAAPEQTEGSLRHPLEWALGSRHPASLPDQHAVARQKFTQKVKLQKRTVRKSGCG